MKLLLTKAIMYFQTIKSEECSVVFKYRKGSFVYLILGHISYESNFTRFFNQTMVYPFSPKP